MSESIVDRQEKIRAKFASFTDPDDKWKFLLDLAREHKGMDASLKAEKFIIQGCASTIPERLNGFTQLAASPALKRPHLASGLLDCPQAIMPP